MTLHHDSIELLKELLRELDAMPATRLLIGAKGTDYYRRGRAIVARADDLQHIEDRRRLRDAIAATSARYRAAKGAEHALLEALINAKSACAQVGDGDSLQALDTIARIVEAWFHEHEGEKPPPAPPPGPPAGGPFASEHPQWRTPEAADASLFKLHTYTDPGDIGRRA